MSGSTYYVSCWRIKNLEYMDYTEIIEQFKKVPKTFIPGLLIELIEIGHERNVFQESGAGNIAKKVELKIRKTTRGKL